MEFSDNERASLEIEHLLEIRKRIAVLDGALRNLGATRAHIVTELKERYKLNISTGAFAKAICVCVEKIHKNNYKVSEALLRQTLCGLVLLSKYKGTSNPEKSKSISDFLTKNGYSMEELEQYTIGGAGLEVIAPDAVQKHDWVLRWFKEMSSIKVMSVAMVAYGVVPYGLAMATGVWNGTDHPFSDSNAVLIGYPIFAIALFFIHVFYQDLPNSFNAFANQIDFIDSYKKLVQTNFGYLGNFGILLGAFALALSIYLHIHYLHDGKYGYLESSVGVPSLLFFINILLLSWQIFVFIYMLVAFALVLYSVRTLSNDANKAHPEMLKGKVLTLFLQPLARLGKIFFFITVFAAIYGIAYFTGANNFSKRHHQLTEWHEMEMMIMFVPLGIYLVMFSYYLYLLYQMASDLDYQQSFSKRFFSFIEKLGLY